VTADRVIFDAEFLRPDAIPAAAGRGGRDGDRKPEGVAVNLEMIRREIPGSRYRAPRNDDSLSAGNA